MKSVIVRRSRFALLDIAAPVFIVMVILLGRNSALTSPIMGGDEYAYYAGARTLPDISALSERDPYMQWAPNLVFLELGKLLFLISQNAAILMKEVNAVTFSVSVLLICVILYWLSHRRFPFYAPLLIALNPFSAYSAYFMPETLYVLIFVLLVMVLVYFLPEHEWLASSIGGILVGILILTKPHGIAIFIACFITVLSLAILPGFFHLPWKRALASAALFVLSTYVSELLLSWLITGTLSWNPMRFVGRAYNSYVGGSMGVFNSVDLLTQMGANAAGHIVILLFICTIPLSHFVSWLLTGFKTGLSSLSQPKEFRHIHILVVFTLLATFTTLAMTVNFTAQVPEFIRLHGRYYSYVLFLYFLGYFVIQQKTNLNLIPPGGWRLWGIIGLLSSVLMFWVQRTFIIFPWDYPEAFSMSLWKGYGTQFPSWPIIVAGILVYGFIVIKPDLRSILFPIFLLVLFLSSNYRVIEWQFAHSRNVGPQALQGQAIRNLMSETERGRGIIIGNDRYNRMPYFLFGFSSDTWVRDIPEGDRITADMIPPDTEWLILLDDYDLNIPITSSMSFGNVWLGWLSSDLSTIYESVELWDGTPLHFSFGSGEDAYLLDQFNEPESWGAWSATDGARILLPVLVSGEVRIEIVGWLKPENSAQQLQLLIGSTSVPVHLKTTKGKSCLTVNLSEPTRIITLRGVKPFRQNPWDQPQAVALAALNIYQESNISEPCSTYIPQE